MAVCGERAAVRQGQACCRRLMGATNDAQGQVPTKLFEDSLRGLGWISGQNIRIEYRWAAGDRNLARSHAAELGAMNPDVIQMARRSL